MPDAFIGVDVMVGCRGETQACFEDSYAFIESLPVTQFPRLPLFRASVDIGFTH